MKVTKQEFENLLKSKKLAISLIGMSNIGKTYWSKQLTELGFEHYSCDDKIEQLLAPELLKFGYNGISDMAKWMQQPYQANSPQRQKQYLDLEAQVTKLAITQIKSANKLIVVDTTGSFVHLPTAISKELSDNSLVIYLKADPDQIDQLFQRFLNEPKPIVWDDFFKKNNQESDQDALQRCYPNLVQWRQSCYSQYADLTLTNSELKTITDTTSFLNLIWQKL